MEQISPNILPIPENPEIIGTRRLLMISVGWLVPAIVLEVGFHQLLPNITMSQQLFLWIAGPCLAFLIARKYVRLHALRYIEMRRVAAANKRSPISAELPFQLEIFPLPFVAWIVNKAFVWGYLLALLLLSLFLLTPPLIGILTVAGPFLFLIIGLLLIAFLASFLGYAGFSSLKSKVTIETTESGLQFKKEGNHISKKYIGWNEACLFACYKLPGLFPGQDTIYYELSSSTQVITWTAIPDSPSFLAVWRPLLPIDEYHSQMQNLCKLVKDKTGLQLYNLNEPIEKEELDRGN